MQTLPYNPIKYYYLMVWAVPVSLAATKGIARTFFLTLNGGSERKFHILLSFPLGTEMFHFPRCAPAYTGNCRRQLGFPIRKSPDRRLSVTSPKHIADISRPSSLSKAKAFTIHPYIPARNVVHRCTF